MSLDPQACEAELRASEFDRKVYGVVNNHRGRSFHGHPPLPPGALDACIRGVGARPRGPAVRRTRPGKEEGRMARGGVLLDVRSGMVAPGKPS